MQASAELILHKRNGNSEFELPVGLEVGDGGGDGGGDGITKMSSDVVMGGEIGTRNSKVVSFNTLVIEYAIRTYFSSSYRKNTFVPASR